MKKILWILVIVIAAAFGYTWYQNSQADAVITDVDQAYVKAHLGKPGVVVVDVRAEDFYNGKSPREGLPGGHIAGTINFPLADLKKEDAAGALTKAGITKDAEVIVYCNTGKQAGQFAQVLAKDFGFDKAKIKNYRGSITDWAKDPANRLEPEGHE